MIEGQFNIVFAGRLTPGKTEVEVKQNLARLFKTQVQQIERLFIGSEVTLKKNLDYAQAMKYQSALKQAGALVLIKKVDPVTTQPMGSVQKQGAQSPQNVEKPSSDVNNLNEKSDWSVAPPGERLPSTEKPAPIPVPDLSAYSVANLGTTLVEQKNKPTVEVDTSGLSLDELGPLPTPAAKPAPEVDVSGLSVAPPGEKIPNAPDNKPKLNPDTSYLSLE
jgi:hypothetical protein